jgi:hypothetical protein
VRRQLIASDRQSPYGYVVNARRKHYYIHLLARTVASMNVPQVPELLERCVALGSPATKEFVQRTRPECRRREPLDSAYVLVRSHRDLVLTSQRIGDQIALVAETPNGPVEDFFVNGVAGDAIAFAARETTFNVAELPGDLSDEERTAIADALVDAGLFTRQKGSKHD